METQGGINKGSFKHIVCLYAGLVRLYPQRFRLEYGEEMRSAFWDAITDEDEAGGLNLIMVFLREVHDLPGAVIREHFRDIRNRGEEGVVSEVVDFNINPNGVKPSLDRASQPGTWKEALLAGVPHWVIAATMLVLTLMTLNQREESALQKSVEIFSLIFAWSMVGVIVVMLILAWRRGWPRWSASLYFYGFCAIAAPILFVVQNLRAYQVLDILLQFVFVLALVLWIYVVTWRDAIKGLLVMTPVAILAWYPVLEFIPSEIRNPLQLGMFLVIALAAVVVARFGNWRLGIWTIVGSSMLVGIPIAYFRTYHHNIPPEYADPATILMLTGRYASAIFWSSMLVIGPLLVWVLWELSKRSGNDGKVGYRMVFYGLLFNLTSTMGTTTSYHRELFPSQPLLEVLFSLLILLGAAIYILGIVKLFRAARTEGMLTNKVTIALFVLVALGLPLMFMYPMFSRRRLTSTYLPFGLFYENEVPEILTYGVGSLWLLFGGWLITRLRVPKRAAN